MDLISGKMTSKGQITIPKELRDRLKVETGDQFRFIIDEDDGIVKMGPVKRKLLSQAIGRIKANKAIDLVKMREIAQAQAAKEIFSKGNKE